MPQPNGYSTDGDQVVLRMTREDYNYVLFALGYATGGAAQNNLLDRQKSLIELMNRLNQGNPNYMPYEIKTS